uniref:Uncharacterized protein n=1 Tax=Anguilla anguilla TaxID=7936 RepID=A0A0E9WXJ5_ANGAN
MQTFKYVLWWWLVIFGELMLFCVSTHHTDETGCFTRRLLFERKNIEPLGPMMFNTTACSENYNREPRFRGMSEVTFGHRQCSSALPDWFQLCLWFPCLAHLCLPSRK